SQPGRPGHGATPPGGRGRGAPKSSGAHGAPPGGGAGRARSGGPGGKRRTSTFVAGAVGVLVVIAAALYVTSIEDGRKKDTVTTPPAPTATAELPPGAEGDCDSCTGKGAEAMGCSGARVTTANAAPAGATTVEVRYSEACSAALASITQATQGDAVEVTA